MGVMDWLRVTSPFTLGALIIGVAINTILMIDKKRREMEDNQ